MNRQTRTLEPDAHTADVRARACYDRAMTHPAQALVEAAFADRSLLQTKANAQAVLDTIEALDKGQLRVATPPQTLDGEWTTHAWIKQAVLLYFGLRQMEKIEVGPF